LETLKDKRPAIRFQIGRHYPEEFARFLLGSPPDPWQADFLKSESKRIILNCSRQSGKSTTSALKALHTALYNEGSLVLALGPAERQAKEFLNKVTHYYRQMGYKIPARSDRKLGLELDNGSRIEALPGSEKTIRGFSAVDLLLLDEAARIEDPLYYAVRPMLAVSDGTLIMLSTPYGRQGVFYEEWTHGLGWERYRVTAYDVPRITDEFLSEERATMTEAEFRREYMAEFTETEDALIPLAWLDAARERPVVHTHNVLNAGLDVAGPGENETVLVVRDGPSIVHMQAWDSADPRGNVVAALQPFLRRMQSVNVDAVGMGYYMARHLQDHGIPVQDVNVGLPARRTERYANIRAESYWGLRMRLEAGDLRGLTDGMAVSQLAGINYEHNPRGQIVIESKEHARKRGVKSPDRAEAIMLAFHEAPYSPKGEEFVTSLSPFGAGNPFADSDAPTW
jgi:hypothetical protein